MDPDEPVPEADALEQSRAVNHDAIGGPASVGDKPEADWIEQAQPVAATRTVVTHPNREDVPEADWLEQSIDEPLDDEER